jgi:hypothetical protein
MGVDGRSTGEQELVRRALAKLSAGQKLNRSEQAALRRYEKASEERKRREYYRAIPQKHWRELSGRQAKVLNEQEARYGIPVGRSVIDLALVARWMHDFLAANATKLAALDGDDPMMAVGNSPALEEYRKWSAQAMKLKVLRLEQSLVPLSDIHEELVRLARLIRQASERLGRKFGAEAQEIVDEALDDWERELERWLGEEPETSTGQSSA